MQELNNYLPKISVVTPSYNQGAFLEETIQSVLGQGYPNLEYIVIDGGSTDKSAAIIKKYANQIAYWVSEGDRGQSHAINKGFSVATGDILCWLNSDDFYFPGTFDFVASNLDYDAEEILFGNCLCFVDSSPQISGSDVVAWSKIYDLALYDYVYQPSAFWSRKTWSAVGPLNEGLHFALDWDWFIRASRAGVPFKGVDRYLSAFRFHSNHKSSGQDGRMREIRGVYAKYTGSRLENAYVELCARQNDLARFESRVQRLRLSRFKRQLCRFRFPEIFDRVNSKEFASLRGMLPLAPL